MILRRTARWFDDRLGAASFAHRALNKVFPDNWSFMLGEIALYCFLILILTGTFLTLFYQPGLGEVVYDGSYEPLRGVVVSEAYESVLKLTFDVRAGLVMRQIHHWAALVFVAAIVAHLIRIFFTGAFRRPREVNWMIGVTLLILAIFNGFTGYSLPDDLLSGTGLRIAHSIGLSIPVIGTWATFLVFGGEFPAEDILRRLLVVHIMIVPGALVALIGAHMAILWHQKHTHFPGPGRTETNVVGSKLYPTYAAKSIGLFFGVAAVLALMGGLLQINPVWLYGPFEAAAVSSPAQPDWYLGWVEGALRLFPPWEIRAFGHTIPNPFYPAVLLPGITFTLLYLWPFLEARFSGDRGEHHVLDRPRDHPLRSALGATAIAFYAILLVAGSNDLLAKAFLIPVTTITWGFRIALFTVPPVAGFVTHRWLRALRDSDAEDFLHVPLAAFRSAGDRGDGRPGRAAPAGVERP